MLAEGWFPDPLGRHGERWFSDGRPTAIVRDGLKEASDPPTTVRRWTVSELTGADDAGSPSSSPSGVRAVPVDPRKRNRQVAIIYVVVVLATVTLLGLFGPGDSMAPGTVLLVAIAIPSVVWPLLNRRRRLQGDLPYTAVDGAWSAWRALRTGSGNSRYEATRPPTMQVPGARLRNENAPRHVYLFCDNRLIATLTTTAPTPERSYRVGEVDYSVVSYTGPYTERGGRSEAFDVQVA